MLTWRFTLTRKKLIGWSIILIVFVVSYNSMRLYLSMDATDLIFATAFLIATIAAWIIERGGADEATIK